MQVVLLMTGSNLLQKTIEIEQAMLTAIAAIY